jgi:hypothetical protein
MTDEIIEMARYAGFERLGHTENDWVCYPEDIKAFAKLVAAKEREAIIDLVAMYGGPVDLEAAIRTRGKA